MTTSPRLEQLEELHRQLGIEIDLERAAIARHEQASRDALALLPRGPGTQRVLLACCQRYNVDPHLVIDGSRANPVTSARHTFMWLLRATGRTYVEIGAELGMDHTSAMNGVRRVDRDPAMRTAAAEIYRALTGDDLTTTTTMTGAR